MVQVKGRRSFRNTHPLTHSSLCGAENGNIPLFRDLCGRQVLAARCRDPLPTLDSGRCYLQAFKFLVFPMAYLCTPNLGSHIQMPATWQSQNQNRTKQRKTTPDPSLQVDALCSYLDKPSPGSLGQIRQDFDVQTEQHMLHRDTCWLERP